MALPTHPSDRLPAGLCIYGLTWACGLTWSGTAKANPSPLTARQVIDAAAGSGLSSVEMPPSMLGTTTETGRRCVASTMSVSGASSTACGGRMGSSRTSFSVTFSCVIVSFVESFA